MKRFYIIFKGQVQGVGFRWTAMNLANTLGLTGWVRNLDNGDVDIEIQGQPDSLEAFVSQIQQKDNWIRIDDYSIKDVPLCPDERRFKIKDDSGFFF